MHEEASEDQGAGSRASEQERLRALLSQVDAEYEAQRQALAREMHHRIVGSLSAVKMECDWLLRGDRPVEAVQSRLKHLSELIGSTISFTRELIGGLWPAIVAHLGLSSAIQQEAADARARSEVAIDVDIAGDVDDIDDAVAMTLYRLASQAIGDCERQQSTRPAHARLALRRENDRVALDIDTSCPMADDAWLLIEERVKRLHGRLERRPADRDAGKIVVVLPTRP